MEKREIGGEMVFGLDIGTRNVVGTVGYRIGKEFIVMAQYSLEHETRAMIDGQIHDIASVGNTIRMVKEALEAQIGQPLTSVCIAAAGRVLKTVTVHIDHEYETESVVGAEDVHTLDLLGIEKAQSILIEENDTSYKFYCVGYSVIRYFLNDEVFASIEGHKADRIAEDIIVTFLPEDVIDGLYAAVAMADLAVSNLTLEPIAAIDIAIPENFRMLNIALIDVGAGTSDISITKEGSIIAYGMIPLAGDEITEMLAQHYLVDFQTAEHIKIASTDGGEIEYTDIMQIKHTIPSEEVWELMEELVDSITGYISDKIIELNGDKSVKAAFIVGGGGKVHGFASMLADKLNLPYERVALRGEEVLGSVTFEQPEIAKDPLLVTPIGICLNYYGQKNSFILVHFNGERIKLYDNNRLTIVDAALQAGFPREYLFPRRGKEINFTVNGVKRIARGEAGESAVVKVNQKLTNINAPLIANSYITVEPSTVGKDAFLTIADITDHAAETMSFIVNGQTILCPKFVEANGEIALSSYEIKEGDEIETRSFYTIRQLAEFMDVHPDPNRAILVNNRPASMDTLVYENFSVEWSIGDEEADASEFTFAPSAAEPEPEREAEPEPSFTFTSTEEVTPELKKEAEPEQNFTFTSSEAVTPELKKEAEEEQNFTFDSASEPEPEREAELEPSFTFTSTAEETPETEEETKPDFTFTSEEAATPEPEFTHTSAAAETPDPDFFAKESADSDFRPEDDETAMLVSANGKPVWMTGKTNYILVDIFDFIDFDLKASNGRAIVIKINGEYADYVKPLKSGDIIEIYWEEK